MMPQFTLHVWIGVKPDLYSAGESGMKRENAGIVGFEALLAQLFAVCSQLRACRRDDSGKEACWNRLARILHNRVYGSGRLAPALPGAILDYFATVQL